MTGNAMNEVLAADPYKIDKARVRASFDRAAASYDAAAILQTEVRERMLSRLDVVNISPDRILDAGCGTGRGSALLTEKFASSRIVAMDIAPGMLQQTIKAEPWHRRLLGRLNGRGLQPLCADMERLPLADASFGLVWSNLAIQWCNDLDQVFQEMYRTLVPNGLFMFSTFGPDTLRELRVAAATDETHVRVSRFIDMHDIGDALVRAGFSAPVLDVERFELTYDDVRGVMRDLKAIGAHNAATGRQRGLQGRGFLQQLETNYERFRKDGRLPATYEVVYGHAWKPEARSAEPAGDKASPVQFYPRRNR